MHEMSEKKFMAEACHEMYKIFTDEDALFAYLETYVASDVSARELKNTDKE